MLLDLVRFLQWQVSLTAPTQQPKGSIVFLSLLFENVQKVTSPVFLIQELKGLCMCVSFLQTLVVQSFHLRKKKKHSCFAMIFLPEKYWDLTSELWMATSLTLATFPVSTVPRFYKMTIYLGDTPALFRKPVQQWHLLYRAVSCEPKIWAAS